MKINFESKPVYGNKDKYIKTIYIYIHIWWQYDYKFSWQKYAKKKAPCKCLSIIMLDSVIKQNKKYYPQTLLEEICTNMYKKR